MNIDFCFFKVCVYLLKKSKRFVFKFNEMSDVLPRIPIDGKFVVFKFGSSDMWVSMVRVETGRGISDFAIALGLFCPFTECHFAHEHETGAVFSSLAIL